MAKKRLSTQSWNDLSDAMLGRHSKRFNAILETMDDDEFAKNYIKMLEYVVPKKQRTEILDETPAEDKIVRVQYVTSEADIQEENNLDNGTEGIDGIQEDE